MQRAGHSVFMLESVQPFWLRETGSYFVLADGLLGAAIGILVAPLVLIIPGQFGPGNIESLRVTMGTAVLTGTVLGVLSSGLSRALATSPRATGEHEGGQTPGAHAAQSATAGATTIGDEGAAGSADQPPADRAAGGGGAPTPGATEAGNAGVPADRESAPTGTPTGQAEKQKKGWGIGSVIGCVQALSWIGVAVGFVLYALNWLASSRFATAVGLGNALAVLLVSIAMLLYRMVEGQRLREGAPFIRPAEALGWSTSSGLAAAIGAALWSPFLLYPATRLLDGWLGNRPEATVSIRERGFSFDGELGILSHFFGLSDQGVALLLFLLLAMLTASAAIGGLRSRFVDLKTQPNQGMRLSSGNSLRCMAYVGLPVGVILGLGAIVVRPLASLLPSIPPALPLEVVERRLRPQVTEYSRELSTRVAAFATLPDSAPSEVLDSLLRDSPVLRWYLPETATDRGFAMRQRVAAAITRDFDADTLVHDLARHLEAIRISPRLVEQRWNAMAPERTLHVAAAHQFLATRSARDTVAGLSTLPLGAGLSTLPLDTQGTTRARVPAATVLDELFAPAAADDPTAAASPATSAWRGAGRLLLFWNGLALGIAIGGLAALLNGGMAVIRHGILRLWLRRRGVAPLDYVGFLEHAANELGFLQRVGGGYMFIHRMLLEHFAEEGRSH